MGIHRGRLTATLLLSPRFNRSEPSDRFGNGLVRDPKLLADHVIAQAKFPELQGFSCDELVDWRAGDFEEAHLEWKLGRGSNSLRPGAASIASQPLKSVPSSNSPDTQASVCRKAMPVSSVR